MKKSISFLVLFVLVVAGVFAQNAALRNGMYQAVGSSDEIGVVPDHTWNYQTNLGQQMNGYYLLASYVGRASLTSPNCWYRATGPVVGNTIRTNVCSVNWDLAYQIGAGDIEIGEFNIWTIINFETFEANGVRFHWVRTN